MTAFIRALFFYHASLKEDVKWDLFHSCQQCVTLISSPMPSFDTLEESTGERSKARDHMKRTLKRSSLMCSDSPWQCGGVVIFLLALLKQRIKRCLTLSGCCAILPWRGDNTQLQGSVTYYNFVSPLITAYISLPGHSWLQFQLIYFLCWWKDCVMEFIYSKLFIKGNFKKVFSLFQSQLWSWVCGAQRFGLDLNVLWLNVFKLLYEVTRRQCTKSYL